MPIYLPACLPASKCAAGLPAPKPTHLPAQCTPTTHHHPPATTTHQQEYVLVDEPGGQEDKGDGSTGTDLKAGRRTGEEGGEGRHWHAREEACTAGRGPWLLTDTGSMASLYNPHCCKCWTFRLLLEIVSMVHQPTPFTTEQLRAGEGRGEGEEGGEGVESGECRDEERRGREGGGCRNGAIRRHDCEALPCSSGHRTCGPHMTERMMNQWWWVGAPQSHPISCHLTKAQAGIESDQGMPDLKRNGGGGGGGRWEGKE